MTLQAASVVHQPSECQVKNNRWLSGRAPRGPAAIETRICLLKPTTDLHSWSSSRWCKKWFLYTSCGIYALLWCDINPTDTYYFFFMLFLINKWAFCEIINIFIEEYYAQIKHLGKIIPVILLLLLLFIVFMVSFWKRTLKVLKVGLNQLQYLIF